VTANWGPVGVASMASDPLVNGGFAKVPEVSMDGGGGCLREARNSVSNREGRFPNEAAL
jgi:hypothetical protein